MTTNDDKDMYFFYILRYKALPLRVKLLLLKQVILRFLRSPL